MEVNKIMQSELLDIIFEGRNKDYGAYELRTNYGKRLGLALLWMIGLSGTMIMLYSFANKPEEEKAMYTIEDRVLTKIPDEKPVEPPPAVKPPPQQQEPVKMKQFVVPLIVDDVKPEDIPPTQDELADAKIGNFNQEGDGDPDIVRPPIDDKSTGVIEGPKPKDAEPEIYLSVQIESAYPGGISAWTRYLSRTLPKYYTGELVEREIQGRVIVQFIVDKEGNVSEVHGIEGPKELWPIAEKVIKASGKWTPAEQNGNKVKSYKRQPLIFQIESE